MDTRYFNGRQIKAGRQQDLYNRLTDWGYGPSTVGHSQGEQARDGDGFHEVPVNTADGFWSRWRSCLQPHRGIAQEKRPWSLDVFESVPNARIRGNGLLRPLLERLLA